jgi:hypothetical protein
MRGRGQLTVEWCGFRQASHLCRWVSSALRTGAGAPLEVGIALRCVPNETARVQRTWRVVGIGEASVDPIDVLGDAWRTKLGTHGTASEA